MKRFERLHRLKFGLPLVSALAMSGCIEYTIDTTLREDGGGTREVTMEVRDAEDNTEIGLDMTDFRRIMFVPERDGWTHETTSPSGDTIHLFTRSRDVQDLSSWAELNDEIRIAGARPSRSSESVGYLNLGDVQFRNRVMVGSSRRSDGSASFSYTETFSWEKGVEALLELMAQEMEAILTREYPSLSNRARWEIMGLARARFQEAVEDGVFDEREDEWDEIWERSFAKIAEQGIQVLHTAYPREEEDTFREKIDIFSGQAGDELDQAFMQALPGVHLAISAEITFRLTMPGTVTASNAHRRDGTTLIWEFSPGDALTAPVVLTAESAVGGR